MKSLVLALALTLAACAAPPNPPPATEAAATPAPSPYMTATPGLDASPSLRASVEAWARPGEPFRVLGDIYFVGGGVASYLITTPQGHFLIDGGPAELAPSIVRNVEALGFHIRDVKILLNSHAHFDHSGGLAALQAASGAHFYASEADRPFLESGHIPFGPASAVDAAPIHVDHVLHDGEAITLGGVTLTAYLTPGHTPGCTSFAMTAQDSHGAPRAVFFHCSASVGGQSLVPESYPGMVADYRATFARVGAMHADVLLTNHPEFIDMAALRARQANGERDAFVDPTALQRFNARMQAAFEAELARQQAAAR